MSDSIREPGPIVRHPINEFPRPPFAFHAYQTPPPPYLEALERIENNTLAQAAAATDAASHLERIADSLEALVEQGQPQVYNVVLQDKPKKKASLKEIHRQLLLATAEAPAPPAPTYRDEPVVVWYSDGKAVFGKGWTDLVDYGLTKELGLADGYSDTGWRALSEEAVADLGEFTPVEVEPLDLSDGVFIRVDDFWDYDKGMGTRFPEISAEGNRFLAANPDGGGIVYEGHPSGRSKGVEFQTNWYYRLTDEALRVLGYDE